MKTIKLLTPLRTTHAPRGKQFYIYQNYIEMFKKINAVLIFISPEQREIYQELAEICDGLLLVGGDDIDASYYNEPNNEHNELEIPEVDRMDFDLVYLFDKLQKPIIGICRGHQILNVAFGGSLYQDIATQYQTSVNHRQDDHQQYCHHIEVIDHSTLSHYLDNLTSVNSFHHQCIKNLATGFQVMAYSEDGIIEAIEKKNVISLQWHPEKTNDENQKKILQMFLHLFL
ncbi:MAG: gamma-glutamyl-gamma-aminobutyrate hydrolase family protein [Faecalibacillus sp.]